MRRWGLPESNSPESNCRTNRFRPGDAVPVTLYLRADQPLAEDYELFLQMLDENGQEIANITTHPGWGRRPTSLWEPGALYADEYLLRITRPIDGRAPLLARVYTGFVDPATADMGNLPLPASSGGQPVTPFVGTVAVSPVESPTVDSLGMQPVGAIFGDTIRVDGACIVQDDNPAQMTVRLLYEALGAPATRYTGFVHALDNAGARVDGFDRAPAGDRFPTSEWRSGDAIVTDFPLASTSAIPLTLWTGLYESASQGAVRLPVTHAAGMPSGNGQIALPALLPECRSTDW